MTNKTEVKIISIVDTVIKKNGFNPNHINDEADLLEEGAIDSLDLVKIICEISETLQKTVDINNSSAIINKKWFLNTK